MAETTQPNSTGDFQCPLVSAIFASAGPPFPSRAEANDAVAEYKASESEHAQQQRAHRLYVRHLPLIRKTLARFCPRSRCYSGGCLAEELVGETYPVFRQLLDDFDPTVGLDFLGYASQRLYWGLEHRARRLERVLYRSAPPEGLDEPTLNHAEQKLLDRLLAQELLATLRSGDASLMARHAMGFTNQELASSTGVSYAALLKKLERIRRALRDLTEGDAEADAASDKNAASD